MAITEHILIEYKAIMDEDFAIIKLMVDEYCSPKFLAEGFLKVKDNDFEIKKALAVRPNPNPLYACLKPELFGETSASLYKQLYETKYDAIVDRTVPSILATVISTLQRNPNNNMQCTVLCYNKEQADVIARYDPTLNTIIHDRNDLENFDVSEFTSIFCKDIINLLSYKNLVNKNIYIARLVYNLDLTISGEFKPKVAIMSTVGTQNKLNLIDYYTMNMKKET